MSVPMARHQHVRPILLVEDDPDLRDAVRLVLEDAGYDVVCAGEGREALTRVRESPFSLVLLDLMLPVMDGFEFRVQQMQDPDIASIPVIVFSCGGDLQEKVAPLRVAACLRKPVDVDALLELIGVLAKARDPSRGRGPRHRPNRGGAARRRSSGPA